MGYSLQDIAAEVGAVKSTICLWVKGIEPGCNVRKKKSVEKWEKIYEHKTCDIELFKKLASSGRSRFVISKKMELSLGYIKYLSSKLNIKVKDYEGAVRYGNTSGICLMCKTKATGNIRYCNTCISRMRRFKRKKRCVEYKGCKCEKCGWTATDVSQYAAFHFHHNSSDKEFTISSQCKNNWEKIKTELDKCEIVCANCHNIIHSKYQDFVTIYKDFVTMPESG